MLPSRRIAAIISVLALVILPFIFLFSAPAVRAARGQYVWPVGGPILRGFEKPLGPYGEGGHQGVDLGAEPGEKVRAANEGQVSWVGELPRGRFVSISHSGAVRTTYLDLATILVSAGESVSRGQVIGTVGGTRDRSSARPHLHFDTYLNGTPVDPRLLFDGFDVGSYIRLCPVKRTGGSGCGGTAQAEDTGGPLSSQRSGPGRKAAATGNAPRSLFAKVARCFSSAWHGTCALAGWIGSSCRSVWSDGIYPVLRGTWRGVAGFACRAWHNRYVRAVAAGLAAAAVVVMCVIIAFLLLPISAAVAAVAAVAGALACIGMAIYFAATHGADFSFSTCFFKSLSAGLVVASSVVSWGLLSGTAEAGWAAAGLSGTCKAMIANGLSSTIFDTCINYLFGGRITLKNMLIAFVVGAVTGGIGKVLRDGMMQERLARLVCVAHVEATDAVSLSGTTLILVQRVTTKVEVFLLTCKELALTSIGKVAFMSFSGSLAASINIITCMVTHRPITFSGVLASFLAGAAVGGLALSFGGHGLNGMLARFRVFRGGLGVPLRKLMVKIINKGISRGLKNGLENLFKKVLKEKEVSQ